MLRIKPSNMKASLIFLSGLATGAVLGLLIAPESGRGTVRKIKREADRLVDKLVQKQANSEVQEREGAVIVD